MSEGMRLSVSDVARLLTNPSPKNRAETVSKVATEFSKGKLDTEARALATEIFRIVVHDAELRVRKALAECVKDNPDIPYDVALTLARDVSEVAVPVLENSSILDDEDLLEIVRNFQPEHQIAVASRAAVSSEVADALVETHNEDVVATLVANDGAMLTEKTMSTVLDEFGGLERINAPMARRGKLPITIAERLVSLVSESMRDYIVTHHEISRDLASDLILESRERATVGLLGPDHQKSDVRDLVNQLYFHGRLTPTLILRAVCMGDTLFFEVSLAKLANISFDSAYSLIHDSGNLGLKSLFDRGGLPGNMLKLARVAIKVKQETDYDGQENDRERFRARMIERVLTTFETGIDAANLDYFISKLGSDEKRAIAS